MSDNEVLRALLTASDHAHQAEIILDNQVGVDLTTEQWLARATISAQIAQVDAVRALAMANQQLVDKIDELTAVVTTGDRAPADAGQPFRGYCFG